MVKFGKEFRKYQIKQWKDKYINYKLLKQEIKAIKNNIDQSRNKSRKIDSTVISDIGHPSIKSLELVPEDSISIEIQDLHSLYNIRHGNELKRFIELLEKEFRKSYIHFVTEEKELYKKVNGHCYSLSLYKDYVTGNICNEIKEIYLTLKLTKQLNCFINDNVMALKKILKKFDKKFQRYFGIITPKYILTHLTSQNSDLEYLLQFKLIDESTTVCENNLNILLKFYKRLKGKSNINENNNTENQINQTAINYENAIYTYSRKINECLDTIDELTYFKIQYREWFYYAKQNERLVKNKPKIFENDIFNPILSSTYYKDSPLEKCITSKNALKEVEKSQSPLSHSNTINLILIYIQACIYGTILTGILPVIPNYFWTYFNTYSKALFLIPLIITYIANLLPFTFFVFIDYIDKKNFYLKISYLISYVLILISSILLYFVQNNDSTTNLVLIIFSRILVGCANNQMFSKKYITLYLPKFRLSRVSKIYLLSEIFGMILGPLITLILTSIDERKNTSIKYTHFNCIGWYGFFISIFFCLIHFIFFVQPLSYEFFMVKDESNITGNNYYQRSESEINRKQYIKEQNLMYKKTYNSMKKKQKENENNNDNNIINDKDNVENLIIKNVNIEKKDKEKEEKEEKEDNIIKTGNDLEEKLIDNDNNKNNESFDSANEQNNSLDVSGGGNIALTIKQKNMINEIEKVLEKRNEECNFNDMNQIPKTINLIINRERKSFGYINKNLLISFIIFFIISIIKTNLIFNYLYYIQEKLNQDNKNVKILCLIIFALFFIQIITINFIFPFYQVNYKYRIFMIISVTFLVLLNLPLIIDSLYNNEYIFIILNILMVLSCDVIYICCSCYLSFLLSPEWKIFGRNVSHWTYYIIICGKILGGIICMTLCSMESTNHWVLVGITFSFFICILILIFFTRILKIRGITRVIRKTIIEFNLEI